MNIGDAGVVRSHYGSPFAEERRLRSGDAFTLLARDVIRVSGADRGKLLHLISSQNFEDLAVGDSSEMLVLDAQGHVVHGSDVVVAEDAIWLITEQGRGAALIEHLKRMTFMMRVETVAVDSMAFGLMVTAAQLPDAFTHIATVVWQDPWPTTAPGGAHYGVKDADHPAFNSRRCVVVVPRGETEHAIETLLNAGLSAAGTQAWEAARVMDWRPSLSGEGSYSTLPNEVDWLRTAVHTEKGCYPGQETVAKLINLGKPPRRLTFLYLEGDEELPEPGTPVTVGGKPAGIVTSVARSVDDGPVALALLKRSVPLDVVVEVGDFVASQVAVVSREGKSSVSPSERPGAGLSARRLASSPSAVENKSVKGR